MPCFTGIRSRSYRSRLPMCLFVPLPTSGHVLRGIPFYDDYDVSSGMLMRHVRKATVWHARWLIEGFAHARPRLCGVGNSIQSMSWLQSLRDNAQVQLWPCRSANQVPVLRGSRQATKIALESAVALGRAWEYWVARAKKAMPDIGEKTLPNNYRWRAERATLISCEWSLLDPDPDLHPIFQVHGSCEAAQAWRVLWRWTLKLP